MKKSKFLKKSLAMLLAVMLVVAMIPLSAAAATELPDLTKLYIDDIAINAENGTFESNVADDAPDVELRAENGSMGMAGHVTADLDVVKPGSTATKSIVDNGTYKTATVNFSEGWATKTEEGYELTLRVSYGSDYKDYTVVLNKVVPSATTNLQNANKGEGVYEVQVNNASKMVSLTVPKDFNYTAKFTVETQDGATITANASAGNGKAGVTVPTANDFGKYTISVNDDKQKFTVVSASKDVSTEWTISVNAVDNLTAFSLGDYEGTISGTTVTVEVPRADLYNQYGKLQDIATTVNYDTYDLQTTVNINGTNYADGASFTVPVSKDNGTLLTQTIYLTCAGIPNVQTYTLNVVVAESSSTAIQMARFNDEFIETVDGTTISAVLPNVSKTDLENVRVILYTDKADHVKSISGFVADSNPAYQREGMDVWTSKTGTKYNMDLSKDRIVTVTAEDGTTQTYTLSASLAETKTEATIKSIYLRDENGNSYEGSVTNNTITFNNIPYMTLNVDNWDILYTPDSQNTRVALDSVNGTAVISGQTKASELGFTPPLSTEKDANKVVEKLYAVNKNDSTVFTKYDVIINLAGTTQDGKTLTNLEISIQNVNPTDKTGNNSGTNAEVYDRVTAYNTIKADANKPTITISDDGDQKDNNGTIVLKPANSLSGDKNLWLDDLFRILTQIDADGVTFIGKKSAQYNGNGTGNIDYAELVTDLPDDLSDFTDGSLPSFAELEESYVIVVLPEEAARNVLTSTSGTYGQQITPDDYESGTVYSFDLNAQNPLATGTLTSFSVKGNSLTVDNGTDTDLIGTLPYSVTAADDREANAGDWVYVDFEVSPHARIKVPYIDGNEYWLRDGGDTDDDGVANTVSAQNVQFAFKRNANHSVTVLFNATDPDSNGGKGNFVPVKDNEITVVAENGKSTITYNFDKVKWEEPNTDPLITAFSIDGYTGSINGENITVTLPYGTDLKGLVPTFTTSSGATVTINRQSVISGQTFVNFTHPVELLVTAEDEQHTKPYTVTVKLDEAFKDVKPTDWFFEDVMQAASAGIVKGQGDGIFAPKDNVTRRDFAIMLCRVLGVDLEGDAVVPFVDVKPDDYGIVAIAYCASHGIVNGYEDTTFRPNEYITRQEAAKMISVAMGVSNISDEKYPDDANIADWASDYVYMAKAAGLMKGDADTGNFRPTSKITRAEAATIMMNAYNQ